MARNFVSLLSRLVVLPHSVFALPFALSAFFLSLKRGPLVSVLWSEPTRLNLLITLFVTLLAVVSARTAAMAFNRLVDAHADSMNQRTACRELPQGLVSKRQVFFLISLSSFVFLLCSWALGMHCLVLSPFVLALLFGYSYTKRFTLFSHFVLGLALGAAPGGAWWIFRPQVELTPLLLMLSVLLWVAGFDVLYSCQDEHFDREHGLHSIPAALGTRHSLLLSRLLHLFAFFAFVAVGWSASLGMVYFAGLTLLAFPLIIQHTLVSPEDLSRINLSFFTSNGIVSIGFFLLVILSL